jgi:hypothetical protein
MSVPGRDADPFRWVQRVLIPDDPVLRRCLRRGRMRRQRRLGTGRLLVGAGTTVAVVASGVAWPVSVAGAGLVVIAWRAITTLRRRSWSSTPAIRGRAPVGPTPLSPLRPKPGRRAS